MEYEMKSERRHELRENDLADSVEQVSERLRPYVTPILSVAIGALVLVLISLFVSSRWEATRSESWDTCLAALVTGDPEGFREVILRYPGTPAAQWAELILADRNLSEATDLLFAKVDPANDVARERLQTAATAYADVLSQRPPDMVAERATMGLAKARESLGELDQARRGYEAVANEYPSSPMANLATEHADDLAQDKTKAFYNWFAEQRRANVMTEEASASKEGVSSNTGQLPVEAASNKENTDKKSTKEKEVESSSTPESVSEE